MWNDSTFSSAHGGDNKNAESKNILFCRRKFSTKDCADCPICSDNVFEICHPHISSLAILSKSNGTNDSVYCPMCQRRHQRNPKFEFPPERSIERRSSKIFRRKVVMGSSDLHNLWRTKSFKPNYHIDFDIIIGGKIHDSHASFILQYYHGVSDLIDMIFVCGVNNIPTNDSSKMIIIQFESFLRTFYDHSKDNRIVICPILYAPKFCITRPFPSSNHLLKMLEVNQWIREFNKRTTGITWDLSRHGVMKVPTNLEEGVVHDFGKWREPNKNKMLHLNFEAKESVAAEILQTFDEMSRL